MFASSVAKLMQDESRINIMSEIANPYITDMKLQSLSIHPMPMGQGKESPSTSVV